VGFANSINKETVCPSIQRKTNEDTPFSIHRILIFDNIESSTFVTLFSGGLVSSTPPPAPPNPPSSPLPQTAAAVGSSMAMVNMNNLLNGKDSRWLQLEVCREFQRNKCTRPDTECKFAHPPANVEVQNGRVTACYDSIKVRADLCMPQYYMEAVHYKMAESWNQRHRAQCHQLCSEIGSSSLFVCMSS
jgi:muscleblind protein